MESFVIVSEQARGRTRLTRDAGGQAGWLARARVVFARVCSTVRKFAFRKSLSLSLSRRGTFWLRGGLAHLRFESGTSATGTRPRMASSPPPRDACMGCTREKMIRSLAWRRAPLPGEWSLVLARPAERHARSRGSGRAPDLRANEHAPRVKHIEFFTSRARRRVGQRRRRACEQTHPEAAPDA